MAKESSTVSGKEASKHPPYLHMITEALAALKERTGSSVPSMAKFLEQKYGEGLPENFRKMLSIQLKRLVKSEILVKVKNSYKLAAGKKTKEAKVGAVTKKKEKGEKSNNKDKEKAEVKNNLKKKTTNAKASEAKKVVKKAIKTKRLSLVKSPGEKVPAGGAKEKSKKKAGKTDATSKSTTTKKKAAAKPSANKK